LHVVDLCGAFWSSISPPLASAKTVTSHSIFPSFPPYLYLLSLQDPFPSLSLFWFMLRSCNRTSSRVLLPPHTPRCRPQPPGSSPPSLHRCSASATLPLGTMAASGPPLRLAQGISCLSSSSCLGQSFLTLINL